MCCRPVPIFTPCLTLWVQDVLHGHRLREGWHPVSVLHACFPPSLYSLAHELVTLLLSCNCICPARIHTPLVVSDQCDSPCLLCTLCMDLWLVLSRTATWNATTRTARRPSSRSCLRTSPSAAWAVLSTVSPQAAVSALVYVTPPRLLCPLCSEVAYLALYLASGESAFVTGAAYPLDGGVSCHM